MLEQFLTDFWEPTNHPRGRNSKEMLLLIPKKGYTKQLHCFNAPFRFESFLWAVWSFRHDVQDKPIKTVFERPKVKLQ